MMEDIIHQGTLWNAAVLLRVVRGWEKRNVQEVLVVIIL